MKSLLTFIISLNLVISPYAMGLERTNLVGIDETTENFIDGVNRERGSSSGVTGNPGTSRGSTATGSSGSTAQARTCAPGEIYNTYSKKCMGSEESRILNAEADQECNVLTDPQLKASCVNSRVTEKTTRAEDNGDMGSHSDNISKIKLLPIFLAFATLYAGILHMVKKPADCKGSMSSYAMIGGAVTILATEAMTKLSFSKELKKSQKELEEIVKGSKSETSDNKNATDLQAEIFDALIKRERGVIKAAEGKKKGYSLAKLMFVSATVLAGIEIAKYATLMASIGGAPAAHALYFCTMSSTVQFKNPVLNNTNQAYAYIDHLIETNSKYRFTDFAKIGTPDINLSVSDFQAQSMDAQRAMHGHYSSITLDEYDSIKKHNKFDKTLSTILAHVRSMIMPEAHAAVMAVEIAAKPLQKMFLSPFTRLALAGIMTAVTFNLTGHADKEIKKANKRIEVLEKLKSQVTEAGPTVNCANGTEQGTAGCKQIVPTTIKPGDSTFGLAATQANGSARTNGSSPFAATGCAKSSGQPDPECGCKKSNSCFSMSSNFKVSDFPGGSILGSGVNDVNALTSGAISPAGLDSAAINRNLAAAGKMRDKVLSDLNKNPNTAKEISKAQDIMNGMQRQIFNSMPANGGGAGNSLALSEGNDLSGLSGNQILEQVKEELKEASAPKVTNEAVAGSGESDFNFDIGTADPMNVGTGLTEAEGTANTNLNDFELAESEINPSSTTNIFEILSSRYKKSAYMRLLKADKEITPEAPAEKEIND